MVPCSPCSALSVQLATARISPLDPPWLYPKGCKQGMLVIFETEFRSKRFETKYCGTNREYVAMFVKG